MSEATESDTQLVSFHALCVFVYACAHMADLDKVLHLLMDLIWTKRRGDVISMFSDNPVVCVRNCKQDDRTALGIFNELV